MKNLEKLIETSKQVLKDCSLENGALVAANPIKPYYSKEAKHYLYVWPRDGAYNCIASDIIGITDIQKPFFDWIWDRAENLHETGLLYEKYYVNGLQALNRFQPDQGASVIIAICHCEQSGSVEKEEYHKLVKLLADGICKHWKEDHFDLITNDLWEERHTFPDLKENFTYSLAACICGLQKANEMAPNEKYQETINQMQKTIQNGVQNGQYVRSFGDLNDDHIDASLLGLVWPFNLIDPKSPEMTKTVDEIITKLSPADGVHRYENDEYDGWMYQTMHRKKGAGYWPLLNFWLAIVLNRMDRKDEALKYFNKVIEDIPENNLIPEQIFTNNIQKAVNPLCWSHGMFILAAKELNLI